MLSRFDDLPASVRAAATESFCCWLAPDTGPPATTVYDSLLEDQDDDSLLVQIVARAPTLYIELHVRVGELTCGVLGCHRPPWPTVVEVRSPDRTIDVPVEDGGRILIDRLVRGPKQFVYRSAAGRVVRTDWLNL